MPRTLIEGVGKLFVATYKDNAKAYRGHGPSA
jgi:hypothetical protein